MDDHLTIFANTVSKSEEEIITLEDIFDTYSDFLEIDLEHGHDFITTGANGKIIPSLKFATEEDAEDITKIFKEVYDNTYPYKRMESITEILNMIKSPNYYWIVFKLNPNSTIGCIGIHLDFDYKIATLFGFAFKKKNQQKVDISTASLACMVASAFKFRSQISIWSCEIRSSFTSIQYLTAAAGLRPMVFLPNKDIFYDTLESEMLFIIHSRSILLKKRCPLKPEIISQAIFCYFHAFRKNSLELPTINNHENLHSKINKTKTLRKQNLIIKKTERDKFGSERITFTIKDSESYFQFLYHKNLSIIEKAEYKVNSLEELLLFLEEIKNKILLPTLRYFEIYLSAYNSSHQKLFFNTGFKPTGYVPAFWYNRTEDFFEDRVVFVYHEKELNRNVCLIPETEEFLKEIKYYKEIKKK